MDLSPYTPFHLLITRVVPLYSLDQRCITGPTPGSSHNNSGVLPGNVTWVDILASAWLPRDVLARKCSVEAASPDPHDQTTHNTGNDGKDLPGCNNIFDMSVLVQIFIPTLPIGNVEVPVSIGINGDLSFFGVASGLQSLDESADRLFVVKLLLRLREWSEMLLLTVTTTR